MFPTQDGTMYMIGIHKKNIEEHKKAIAWHEKAIKNNEKRINELKKSPKGSTK